MDFNPNIWTIVVAGVAAMVTGFLWYGPLFSKPWMKEMGINPDDSALMQKMQGEAKTAYPIQFVGALLMAYVLAHILNAFDSDSVGKALQGALWTWLGLIVPVKLSDKIWGGKSWKLFFLDTFYYLLNLVVFAIIFTYWK